MDIIDKNNDVELLGDNIPFHVDNQYDILTYLNLSFDDEALYKSVIDSIETQINDGVGDYKVMKIPTIGNVRIKPNQIGIREHKEYFKTVVCKDIDEYREICRSKIKESLDKYDEERARQATYRKLRTLLAKSYNKLVRTKGIISANNWIYYLTKFEPIDFDEEVQNWYDDYYNNKLNNNENNS